MYASKKLNNNIVHKITLVKIKLKKYVSASLKEFFFEEFFLNNMCKLTEQFTIMHMQSFNSFCIYLNLMVS